MITLKIIILLVIAGLLLTLTQMALRMGHGAALVQRSMAFSTHPPQPTFRILVAGDSTAVGTGVQHPKESVAGRLAQDLPHAEITNIGVNGLKTRAVAGRLAERPSERFDLIVLQTGGNDILRWTPLASLKEDLQRLLMEARKRSDLVVLLTSGNVGLAPLFPRPLSWFYTFRTQQVRTIFQTLAAEQDVAYVDLYKKRKDDVFLTDPKRYYASDFFHPSGDGYGVWYKRVRETLSRLGVQFGT